MTMPEEYIDDIFNPVFKEVSRKLKHQFRRTPEIIETEQKIEELQQKILQTELFEDPNPALIEEFKVVTRTWGILAIKNDMEGGEKKEIKDKKTQCAEELDFNNKVQKPKSKLFSQLKEQ
jgi:hypothetical protein